MTLEHLKSLPRIMTDFWTNLSQTYCRLRPSPIHGIGVYAIQEIPQGIDPFRTMIPMDESVILVSPEEMVNLPSPVRTMVTDFFHTNEMGHYPVLRNGLNAMTISFYLNHSKTPNLDLVPEGHDYYGFRTNRIIHPGEELLIDYDYDSEEPWQLPT